MAHCKMKATMMMSVAMPIDGSWKEETNHKGDTGTVLKGRLNQRDPTGLPQKEGFGGAGEQELYMFFSLADAFSCLWCLGLTWGCSAPKQKGMRLLEESQASQPLRVT